MAYQWLEWAKQIQSIAQIGLTYGKDVYDLERYEQLRQLSVEIMATYTNTEFQRLPHLFTNESGYATPKVDVRAVVFQDHKILMVQEKNDGAWSLPGGWADIGLTPSEVAVKEVKEESGFEVQFVKLLAVLDNKMHNYLPSPYHIYKLFIQCELIQKQEHHHFESLETSAVGFFGIDELPELSKERNTVEQINRMFEFLNNTQATVRCD